MASALLRTSVGRGSAFRGLLSAAAASSGGEGLAVSLASSPIRRLQHSGAQAGDSSNSLKEKVNLLHQSIKDMNRKVEKAHVVYASVQRLVEEKKPYNPFVQWLWQMGAVALFVFVEHKRSSDENDN
ncbi:unnamed protein product [Urochloa humidicola]